MKNFIYIVIVGIVSSLATILFYKSFENKESIIIREPVYIKQNASIDDDLFQEKQLLRTEHPVSFVDAAKVSIPSVVYIRAIAKESDSYFKRSYKTSTGSGVIISSNGYIVTNFHVIDSSTRLIVTLNDKREFKADLIGVDKNTDLALLKIEAKGLHYLNFGDSDNLQVGEWVIAIGHPFRLESTVTAGIVSAKARNISILDADASVESFIQTDAVVNQGNSGGALVNAEGELIGINSAIITQTGAYEGYSFAIPSNLTRKIIKDIREYGKVKRGMLGVTINNLSSDLAEGLGLTNASGVLISGVGSNSAAAKAGIKEGDVIVSVNSEEIKSTPELQEKIARLRPGDRVKLGYIRKMENFEAEVVLQERYQTDYTLTRLGFELKDLTEMEKKRYGKSGAKVQSIYKNSKISDTQMKLDFIITTINGKPISNAADATDIIKSSEDEIIEMLGFYPQYEGDYTYAFYR